MLHELSINDIFEMKSGMVDGVEAIAWQKTSKVGEQMVALFDKCKAYRKKHFVPEDNNWIDVSHGISKIIDRELPPIWKKELGLEIRKINFNCNEPCGLIGINYMTHEDTEAVYYLDKIVEGSISKNNVPKIYLKRMKEMISKAEGFDRIAGKLKGKVWKVELYIDVTLLFFYDLFCPKSMIKDGTAEMTSRESAAILLHEAGHAMFIIERIVYSYSVQLQMTKAVNGFYESNPSIEDIKEFYSSIVGPSIEIVSRDENINAFLRERLKITKEIVNKIVSFCDLVISLKEKLPVNFTNGYEDPEISKLAKQSNTEYEYTDSDSILEYGLILFIKILIMITRFCSILYWPIVLMSMYLYGPLLWLAFSSTRIIPMFIFLQRVLGVLDELDPELHNSHDDKTSDIKGTAHEVYLNERSADEFSIRHGFGGDLASGLIKMRSMFDATGPTQNNYIRDSKLFLVISKISEAMFKINNGTDNYYTYEWDDKRIKRICQNCIGFFKNAKISPQFRDSMLLSLRKSLDCLEKLDKDLYNRDKFETVVKVIRTLIKPAEWIRILTSGRLTQEYEQHINQIEDLSNNLMFAHSAQFKKILDDMKKKK